MDGEIRLPPDGTGKRLDTSQLSFAGSPRQRQRISVADSENPAGIVAVTNRAMDVNVVSGGLLPLSQPLAAQAPTPRAVVDGAIVLPPDSNGKRLDTSQVTVSGDLVQRQRMVIGDPSNPNGLATVAGGALNVNIAGLGGTPLNISLTPSDGDVLTYDATGGVTGGKWIAKAPAVTAPPDLTGLLPLTGGTMTGPIVLPADPTNALEATTKQYVDDEIANAVTGGSVDLTGYLKTAGGTMTGALVLQADPAANLEAATKQYVDGEVAGINLTGYLPVTGQAADSALLNGKADTAFATAAQGALADTALQAADLTALDQAVDDLADRVDDIEEVIPTQASTTNQLADRDFVNSAVAAMAANQVTKTALGDVMWTSLAEIQAGPWFANGVSHTPAQNDYAIYDNGTEQWRAKYTGTQWQNDFRIGSSLTSTQQAALDSGITATILSNLQTDKLDVTARAADSALLNGKADTAFATAAQGAAADSAGGQIGFLVSLIPTGTSSTNQLANQQYVDTGIADQVAAAQYWLPAVELQADLPTVPDTTKTYLCRVRSENNVYQCIAGQTAWLLYSVNTDFIDSPQLTTALADYLELSGGTMTGPLVLDADPSNDMEAATKQYVDNATPTIDLSDYLELAGGTMTGLLVLDDDLDVKGTADFHGPVIIHDYIDVPTPTSDLHAANKEYVDDEIADQVAASQHWLPAVELVTNLPTITDTSRTYLCRVRSENNVYQCVAGQTAWLLYSVNTDFLPLNGKAADSSLLNGKADTDFVDLTTTQTIGGNKTFDDHTTFEDSVVFHDGFATIGGTLAEIDGNLQVNQTTDCNGPVIIHDYIDVPAPTSDLHAANKKYVDDNFVEEASSDGKMYARKDEDWEEIPAAATGNYLPLTGGTITGSLNVDGQFDVNSDGGVTLNAAGTVMLISASEDVRMDSKVSINGPATFSSTVTLAGDPTQDNQAATKKYVDDRPSGGGLPLTGGTLTGDLNIGSSSAGKSLTVYGDITGNSINTTGSVNLQGTSIRIGSYSAGSVFVESNQGVIFGGPGQMTIYAPTQLNSVMEMSTTAAIRRTLQPSNEVVFDIISGPQPRIMLGSSNIQDAELQVWGNIWSIRQGLSHVYESGSGIFFQSHGGYEFAGGTTTFQGPVRLNNRLYRDGPDGYPIIDIEAGNTPNIRIGSSNYHADMHVWGNLSCSRIQGNFSSWDGRDVVSVGSGIQIYSTSASIDISGNTRLNGPTEFPGRLFRNGPDGIPIFDIPTGNNPTITIGSSNYNAHIQVSGRANLSWFTGTWHSWDGIDTMWLGSGAYFQSNIYPFAINADLVCQKQAYKPGGGPFESWSDSRLKSDTEPYTDGLDKLTQLKPIKFRYNARARMSETGKQYVGLAAEEAKKVMPSIVGTMKAKLDYEDKEPTDVLTVNTGELIYTVINALKQIDKRLKALEQHAEKVTEQATKKAEALSSSPKTAKHK